jgi:hypothetical protein
MAPILGIYASQISGHLFGPSGAYDSIATVTAGAGGASGITFSSIPSTYTHLQIRGIARYSSTGSGGASVFVRLNSDTGSNYSHHILYGNGTSAAASGSATQTQMYVAESPTTSNGANVFSGTVIDILDYANTNKYKTVRSLSGWDDNGSGIVALESGLWQSTSAVSTILLNFGANFAQYSSFTLYGIKGN